MSNKGAKQQRQMAQEDRRRYWDMIGGQESERQEGRARLMPQAEGLLDSGYSPEEESAILQSSLGTIGSTYDVARDRASRRLSRTGSAAGYGAAVAELGRGEAREKSRAASETTRDFADERQRRKMQGLSLLASLYGIDTNLLQTLSGRPLGALAEHSRGIEEPWWKSALAGGAQMGAAFLGKPTYTT